MIKVLICDGDGTLQLPSPSPEILRLITQILPSLGIELAVASNSSTRQGIGRKFTKAGLPPPQYIVTRAEMGVSKPAPDYVYEIQRLAGVELSEIIYLGDDDRTDTFCAINAGVLPITAKYSTSGKPMNYGLHAYYPKAIEDYLLTFGRQDPPYFGWQYSSTCSDTMKPIDIRSLIGQMGNTRNILEAVLKEHRDIKIGSKTVSVAAVLFHYFVSQCYLSGLISNIDWVTIYPGHKVNSINPILTAFSHDIAPVFRDSFKPDLLIRHQDAPKSQFQGSARNIYDQFKTILVNPAYHRKLTGKTVLVIDDFTTHGYSLETARRMLLQAGAESVVGISIAKFRLTHAVTRIRGDWNPFEPCTLPRERILVNELYGNMNAEADDYFHNKIWPHYSA